jgi:RimJ/RimL family protein N-acetyltransferase|tara:strand:+ start:826 stop:1359 length:534 start_codon:yes stop_codon:yes gene_type:complete
MIKPDDHQLSLNKDNFTVIRKYGDQYSLNLVDIENYLSYKSDLNIVLSLLGDQIPDWEERPKDFNELTQRFKSDSKCFLLYYNNQCIGWSWFNEKVRFDWVTVDRDLPNGWIYVGGFYVSNRVDRPYYAGTTINNLRSKYCFDLGYEKLCAYCDSWNENAVRMCTTNGYVYEDWYYL